MQELVEKLSALLVQRNLMMVAAESCTGGMIAAAITSRSGSASVFERGFVTYSNEAKTEMLGVPSDMISAYGAVSMEVAEAMVHGALKNSHAQLAVSVTGIAGPTGATEDKPVGLVYIGWGKKDDVKVKGYNFKGDRAEVRRQSVEAALTNLTEYVSFL
jgi:nicotinamide-nucleotide amidase